MIALKNHPFSATVIFPIFVQKEESPQERIKLPTLTLDYSLKHKNKLLFEENSGIPFS